MNSIHIITAASDDVQRATVELNRDVGDFLSELPEGSIVVSAQTATTAVVDHGDFLFIATTTIVYEEIYWDDGEDGPT
jgi:hypothetical protein